MPASGSHQQSSGQVRGAIARGAAWLTILQFSERGLGLVSTIVLARLLSPQDFGLVAMCMVVVAALGTFTAFGMDVVLIQRQDASRDDYDTAFTIKAISGLVVAILLIASASAVSSFYSDVRLTPIMYIVGANFFVQSLENIAIVDFRKEFKYRREAVLRISVKLVGLATTIPVAMALRNYWALVAGMSATSVFNVALSYVMRPYRPRFTLRAARGIMGFSTWLLIRNAVLFVRTEIHNVFVGRILGANALGTFNMANEVAMMTSTELVAPVNRAVYPGYAKLTNDPPALRATFLDVFALITLLSVPAGVGTMAIADDLVTVVLGGAWLATIPLIKLIAFAGIVDTFNSNMGYIVQALGKPELGTRVATAEAIGLVPVLYFATTHFGLVGTAASLVITHTFVSLPMWWTSVSRLLDFKAVALLARIWRPLSASICMYAELKVLQQSVFADMSPAPKMFASVGVGVGTYTTLVGALWYLCGRPHGGEAIVATQIRERLKSRQ